MLILCLTYFITTVCNNFFKMGFRKVTKALHQPSIYVPGICRPSYMAFPQNVPKVGFKLLWSIIHSIYDDGKTINHESPVTNGESYPSFILILAFKIIFMIEKLEELLKRLNYCQMAFKIRFRSK